jgi:hypothetical protein
MLRLYRKTLTRILMVSLILSLSSTYVAGMSVQDTRSD